MSDQKDALAEGYKEFLNHGKTERECVKEIIKTAEKEGYRNLKEILERKETLSSGDKVYYAYMKKSIVLFQLGKEPLENGLRILGAHIDSPRLDVKQNPLYEDNGFVYLDTHYYGGIKKYQWVTLPLAIHGVVAKKDGSVLEICIGEEEGDPVFCITDLLIHLAGEQLQKKADKVIEGEGLDLLIGSEEPEAKDQKAEGKSSDEAEEKESEEKKKDSVKKKILAILKEKYEIEEKDFQSAELEIVPAGKARDLGADRSMVLGYGQDDRVCAYTSMMAMLEEQDCEKTTCCLLVDKEEIGSVGATGMKSRFFENILAELMEAHEGFSELKLRRCLAESKMLSSDVSAAFDSLYAGKYDKKNAAFFGKGLVFNKYTGSRGKSSSNDANAEYIAWLRNILDEAGVQYQTAELGKVDVGGGGTIAYIMALYGMNVIDSGVAILSMHAPWEASSKTDLLEAKEGYRAFLRA